MAEVILRGIKKVYPNTEAKKSKKKKGAQEELKTENRRF